LSYIGGFGIEEPMPSWGNMLAFEFGVPDGNLFAWLSPAVAIWGVMFSAVLASDALAERRHA
jgi:ABC-type dipeptide/oligopeptide/nickel transport system permease subunit